MSRRDRVNEPDTIPERDWRAMQRQAARHSCESVVNG
jgi:hypothetical protein